MLGGRCSVHPRSVERTRTHSATAASSFEMTVVCGSRLGTAPPQQQSILGVLLRAIYNHSIIIIQLLLRGGSTQGLGFRLF